MEEPEVSDNYAYRVKRAMRRLMRDYWPVLIVGVLFFAIGIFMLYMFFSSLNSIDGEYMPIILFAIFGFAFTTSSIGALIFSLKIIIPYLRDLHILKKGTVSTARIAGHHIQRVPMLTIREHYYGTLRRFAFDLKFFDDGGEHRCKTLHYYDKMQFQHLQQKMTVKVKRINNHVVIIEDFPENDKYVV